MRNRISPEIGGHLEVTCLEAETVKIQEATKEISKLYFIMTYFVQRRFKTA